MEDGVALTKMLRSIGGAGLIASTH